MSRYTIILFIAVFLISILLERNDCIAKSDEQAGIDSTSELPPIECPLRKQGINLHDLTRLSQFTYDFKEN